MDLGFEFKYPEKYGKIDLMILPGDTGRQFSGRTAGYEIRFGGITSDYAEGRGGDILDFSGDFSRLEYLKNYDGPYYAYTDFQTTSGVQGAKVEYLAIDPNDEVRSNPVPGTVVYYFKLNAMFPGAVFVFEKNKVPEHEEIMKSLVVN